MSTPKSQLEKSATPSGSSGNLSNIPFDQETGEDLDILDADLLHRMDVEDIEDLKMYFSEGNKPNESSSEPSTNCVRESALTKVQFIEAMEKLSGNSMISLAAAKLFDGLDVYNEGFVRWESVVDAIIAKLEEPSDGNLGNWKPIDSNVEMHYASHCKREFIVKIVSLYTKLTFCYAVVSKLGRVGVYDGKFSLLDNYKISLKEAEGNKEFLTGEQEERRRRSPTTWITDACFVPDIYAIFFSASDGSLHLYDATGLIHVPLCLVRGLQNTPTCLDYHSSYDHSKSSFLFFGDDQGDVTMMQFHQPKKTLFKKKNPDKVDKFLWTELKEQTEYVTHFTHRNVHNDAVIQISYSPESKTILTCSHDSQNTMVLRHVEKRRQPYIFRVQRGINCFHLEKSLHIVVTGSRDGLVRVWNEVVTKQPIVSLHGHRASVVDVRILKNLSAIISLSEKGVIKIWDLDNYHCQMTVQLNFPMFKVSGSKIEFGTRSIYPGPTVSNIFEDLPSDVNDPIKINSFTDEIETWLSTRDFEIKENEEWNRDRIVIICCNYIALLKLLPRNPDDDFEQSLLEKFNILPPPSREHYASIPTPWKIVDSYTKTPPDDSEDASTAKSSSSSSTRNMPSTSLKKIHSVTSDPVKGPMKNMNTKRAEFRIKQDQMKMLVENCAPHLALDLYELSPIKFSRPLPVTKRMLEKDIDVSDPEKLLREKQQKESTITTGEVFSDAQSLNSSKSSKLAATKKNPIVNKGRQTPDWFAEKLKNFFPYSSESENNSK